MGYGGTVERRHAPRTTGAARGLRGPRALTAPVSGRAWREFGYLVLGLPLGTVYFVLAVTGASLGAGLLVTFVGVPVLAAVLAMCRGIGVLERARARALLGLDAGSPEPLRPARPGVLALTAALLRSGSAWRHLLYSLVHFPWAVFGSTVALVLWPLGWGLLLYPLWFWVFPAFTDQPGLQLFQNGDHSFHFQGPLGVAGAALLGLAVTLTAPWVFRGLTAVDGLLVRGLLGPSPLAARVTELEAGRGVAADAAAADLRRIERDLHEGAQARLAAVALDLGLAKEKLAQDPRAAARMVEEAHGEVKTALRELRDLARGVHPAVLTDRGLDAALSAVAAGCPVPVRVSVELPARPAAAIEGLAYSTVCELLRNAGRHAGAGSVTVDVWKSGGRLMLQVADDGRGGAVAVVGGGLAGLGARLDAVDGVLVVDSPAGGGTTVTAELPWRDRAPSAR
ncbi:sensor histidine kinase [Streptomyces sp. NPDC012888]|uniref:sensor histidine kinase n=1 Tax=Streptomyces sp. NPDC012888 TaxID=3364855 RepID=UPI003692056F